MTTHRSSRRPSLPRILLTGLLGVLLLAGVSPWQANSDEGDPPPPEADAWAPEGAINLAPTSGLSTSSSYQMPEESWDQAFLVDGVVDGSGGWSTSPYDVDTTPTTPAWIEFQLACVGDVSRIVVFPREKSFPASYHFETTTNGQDWTTIPGASGMADDETEPQVHDLPEPVTATTVRLVVDLRNGTEPDAVGRNGHLVQLSEVAIFGTHAGCLDPGKPAVLLEPGQTDVLPWSVLGEPGAAVTWSSSDEAVATIDDGVITAVGLGAAVITMASGELTADVAVTVEEVVERPVDGLVVAAFWAPTPEFINDEQYGNMAEAGIDFIQNVNGNELNARTTNLEMAALAHEHGMHVGVADGIFGERLQSMTPEEIERAVQSYLNVPGVGGFYLKDEPVDALPWAAAFNAVADAAPHYHTHLNFFPYFFYGSIPANNAQMQAWAEATGKRDYLMYDMYPFRDSGAFDAAGFYANLDAVRLLGLANDMRTANYIQSVGIPGNLRRPTAEEIRFEVNATLAYGFKQLSYFTWWQPTNRGEVFTEAIMTADGQKTDLFEPVKQINSEIHALSPVLGGLDAREVYLTGAETHGQRAVPPEFFAESVGDAALILSYLRDPDTGRNHLMVVNQDFRGATDVELRFAGGIDSLEEISRVDGSSEPVALQAGTLATSLAAGDAVLYALPEGFDHDLRATEPNTNLALHRGVEADDNRLGDKWMAGSITDGQRFTGSDARGWRTAAADECRPAEAVVDLARVQDVNRVDVYPAGTTAAGDYAERFPGSIAVDVSVDGSAWTTVAESAETGAAPTSLAFDAERARFVRLRVVGEPEGQTCSVALRQVEVYHDDGDTPPVQEAPSPPAGNVAFGKSVEVSSFPPLDPYATWGWAPEFLVDGDPETGWTSLPGRNDSEDSTEWAVVDLGEPHQLERIVLVPRGLVPIDHTVEVSLDGNAWTTVSEVTGDGNEPTARTIEVDVEARYVRVTGTKLRPSGADGFLMQLGELEVYGEPVDDGGPGPTEEPTEEPTQGPTQKPTGAPEPSPIVPYEVPGFHNVNGRWWYTVCEPYSQTTRCHTSIWATQVSDHDGRLTAVTGWHFNNLTYLPTMTRAQWRDNPLGHAGEWTSDAGRRWRTECDTAATGRGGCRSYIWTRHVAGSQGVTGEWTYRTVEGWVFNNIVRFQP